MQTVLIVIHLMVVVALVAVVLLQRSEGGALGIGGGGGLMTGRGQANVLTRTTAILAAIFFVTSIALTLFANWSGQKSILQGVTPPAHSTAAAPAKAPAANGKATATNSKATAKGNLLHQFKKLEQQREAAHGAASSSHAPALPQVPQAQ